MISLYSPTGQDEAKFGTSLMQVKKKKDEDFEKQKHFATEKTLHTSGIIMNVKESCFFASHLSLKMFVFLHVACASAHPQLKLLMCRPYSKSDVLRFEKYF